jgi:acyl carrier protein
MKIEKTVEMIEEATQALPGAVAPEAPLGGLDGWDSMGMVIFLGLVKEEFEVELKVHDLRACANCHEVRELILRAVAESA